MKKLLRSKVFISLAVITCIAISLAVINSHVVYIFRPITQKAYNRHLANSARDENWEMKMERIYQNPVLTQASKHDFSYEFTYVPFYDELKAKYPLDKMAGTGNVFTRALNLMEWFCANTKYNGQTFHHPFKEKNQYMNLMDYAFRNDFLHAVNCASMAIAFSDCLVAIGIYAMPVWMLNEEECHVTVHVYLPEEQRWIMLDPSFDSYITDETGKALNLAEIRSRLVQDEALRLGRYSFNGGQFFKENYMTFFVYPALFEFQIWMGNSEEQREQYAMIFPDGIGTALSEEQFLAKPAGFTG